MTVSRTIKVYLLLSALFALCGVIAGITTYLRWDVPISTIVARSLILWFTLTASIPLFHLILHHLLKNLGFKV